MKSIKKNFKKHRLELTLIAPEGKPFAIDQLILEEFDDMLDSVLDDIVTKKVRLVTLKSNSPKFFCVGANINALKNLNDKTIQDWVKNGHWVFNKLEDLPVPTVALIDGYAMGGGMEIALCCDFIYATDNAKFSQSEARLGFVPGWGATRRLPERVGIQRAKDLFYRGDMFDASQAYEYNLADKTGSLKELEAELDALERSITDNSAVAIAAFKQIAQDDRRASRSHNCNEEITHSFTCMKTPDTLKRVDRFLNRKK